MKNHAKCEPTTQRDLPSTAIDTALCAAHLATSRFKALHDYARAKLDLAPHNATLWTYLGYSLALEGRSEAAREAFFKAVNVRDTNDAACLAYADACLLKDQSATAYAWHTRARRHPSARYEYTNLEYLLRAIGRHRDAARLTDHHFWNTSSALQYYPRGYLTPRWDGTPLRGRALLVHCADGYGDSLLNLRFLRELDLQQDITLDCPELLYPLFSATFPSLPCVRFTEPLPRIYDCYISLLALPGYSGTPHSDIPSAPYINIRFDDSSRKIPIREQVCRSVISKHDEGHRTDARPRVGLYWRASGYAEERSLALTDVLPLAKHIDLVALQKDVMLSEIGDLDSACLPVYRPKLQDFLDTARQIASVRHVITVDTAVAHLAGAMGKSMTILLVDNPAPMWRSAAFRSRLYPNARFVWVKKTVPKNAWINQDTFHFDTAQAIHTVYLENLCEYLLDSLSIDGLFI
ncbi:tetratricopeptide repeat protein [Robbsia andropogonis]|uniref:tetratricopeptide repeat protein n=1 Tax=Robbsia andropogonis TaxID=28092 RepID=UPI002A6AB183|nr:hypothetical protein [Robbsia andropogonis]